jgi:hypothetical protein
MDVPNIGASILAGSRKENAMRTFDELQSLFAANQAIAIGYASGVAKIYQGARVAPVNNDQFLWDLLDHLPTSGAIQRDGADTFFAAYAEVIGALVASSSPLDPLNAAKRNLADWGQTPPAWIGGYKTMTTRLNAASKIGFKFDVAATPDPGFWGLWRQADPVPGPSARLAASAMSVSIQLGRLLNFAPGPADWYTPAAMAAAYQNPNNAPWNPNSSVTWDTTFGPNGTLRNVVSGLTCASGIVARFVSPVTFGADEQDEIRAAADKGLWPYYLDKTHAATKIVFDGTDGISVTITAEQKIPVFIGVVVQPAAGYFGGQ